MYDPKPNRAVPALEKMAGRAWRLSIIGFVLTITVLVLAELRLVVLPIIIAILISTLFVPPVRWLRDHGWPNMLATWAVLLSFFLAFGLTIARVVPGVADEFRDLGPAVEAGVVAVTGWIEDQFPFVEVGQTDDWMERGVDNVRANAGTIATGLLGGAVVAFEVVAGLILVLVLLFFFVKDGDKITGWIVRQVPSEHREATRAVGRRSWNTLGGYLRGVAIVGAVDAVGIGIGLAVVGVPLVAPLMMLTFFAAFFPLIGALIAGAIAVLVALVTTGPTAALIILAVVVAVQQIESDLISPLVFARAVRLHPVVILVVLTGGAIIAGVVGAFLSVPLVAILAASGNELKKIKGYIDAPEEESGDPEPDRHGKNGEAGDNGKDIESGKSAEPTDEAEKGRRPRSL